MLLKEYRVGDTHGIAKAKTKPPDRIGLQYTQRLFYHYLYTGSKKSILDGCRGGHWPPGEHSLNQSWYDGKTGHL